MSNLSDELAAVVARAGQAVVRVEGRRRLPASGIVWSPQGVIVTAHHVLEEDEHITVGLPDDRTFEATLAGRDPGTDLAALRIRTGGLAVPSWSELDGVRVGHLVLALGRPGKTTMATIGIVSALGAAGWTAPFGGHIDRYLQADVTMYPGFSGGPLVDVKGNLLGLNTSGLLRGVAVSIPWATLRRVVDALLAHGRVRRGYLGVSTQTVKLPEALGRQLNQETGLLVTSLEAGAPASQGGLLLGDIVVSMNMQAMRNRDDLLSMLSDVQAGNAVQVRLVRGGQLTELAIAVGERS
jgi:S1-C subfamily serine protease